MVMCGIFSFVLHLNPMKYAKKYFEQANFTTFTNFRIFVKFVFKSEQFECDAQTKNIVFRLKNK